MHRWSAYTHHSASLNYAFILFFCSSLIFNLLSHVPIVGGGASPNRTEAWPQLYWMFLFRPIPPYPSYLYRTIVSPGYGYSRMEGILNTFYKPQHNTTQHIHKRTYAPVHRFLLWRHFPRLCFTPIPMRSSCPVSDCISYLKLSIQTWYFFSSF